MKRHVNKGVWYKGDSLEQRFNRNISKSNACWEWTGNINVYGYGRLHYKRKMILAHRISYEIYNGKIRGGLFVCHSCDNTRCVNPKHLFLGTQKDNMSDCSKKRRIGIGSRNGMSKLSEKNVLKIRKIKKQKIISNENIGKMFGVSRTCIDGIINRERWNHLE